MLSSTKSDILLCQVMVQISGTVFQILRILNSIWVFDKSTENAAMWTDERSYGQGDTITLALSVGGGGGDGFI